MKNAWIMAFLICSFLLTAACQESKVEVSRPSSKEAAPSENAEQLDVDESVIPPVPITGAWLNAQVLQEKTDNASAEIRVGIASFYNGIKVAEQRDRFMITLSARPNADNKAIISVEPMSSGEYDHIVTIQGPTLELIRAAYATIGVYVTIVDRNDNSSDTWSTPLDAILSDSPSKRVVSSSSSVSTSQSSSSNPPSNPAFIKAN
jgi:hypothetical protein